MGQHEAALTVFGTALRGATEDGNLLEETLSLEARSETRRRAGEVADPGDAQRLEHLGRQLGISGFQPL
jgi:hypothetical protein